MSEIYILSASHLNNKKVAKKYLMARAKLSIDGRSLETLTSHLSTRINITQYFFVCFYLKVIYILGTKLNSQ